MRPPLWTADELATATRGSLSAPLTREITGVSIDTRTLQPGNVFVALRDARDGHEFVAEAFNRGAATALVRADYAAPGLDGPLIRVADTLRALEALAAAARARLQPRARVVAVTGSVGKTGTTAMISRCLDRLLATHAPEKSYNNHWGVPLTLARMPSWVSYGVFEIGMNHAGEITPLTRLVRPHVAVITTVEAVHIENFASVEDIADAKAEIFLGLEPQGVAVINRDNPHFDRLHRQAAKVGARIVSFGLHPEADIRPEVFDVSAGGSDIAVTVHGRRHAYRVAAPGRHVAMNSLAVVAALVGAGADLDLSLPELRVFDAPPGRGRRTVHVAEGGRLLLIDESYNANPTSVRAALAALGMVPRDKYRRRIAVLGDMLELGPEGPDMHAALLDAVDAAGVDLVFAAGPLMHRLFERVSTARQGGWAERASGLEATLLAALAEGDAIMIKGSLGSRMGPLVDAIRTRFPETRD